MHQSCEQQPNPTFCEENNQHMRTFVFANDDEEAKRKERSMTVEVEASPAVEHAHQVGFS